MTDPATVTASWKNVKGTSFSFAKHRKQEFDIADDVLNSWLPLFFGPDDFQCLFATNKRIALDTSLQGLDTIIDRLRQIYITGVATIYNDRDVTTLTSTLAHLNMLYIKGTSDRCVLDTKDSLASLLDYAAINGGYAYIELGIDLLYFKQNDFFNPFHSHEITFTYFKDPATAQDVQAEADRHTAALYEATTALGFCRFETAKLHRAEEIRHATFVTNSKLIFQHAANVAKLHKAVHRALPMTSNLVFRQAAEAARIRSAEALRRAEFAKNSNLVFS